WLRERRRGTSREPLRIDVGDRTVMVELVDGALLLQERQRTPRLTPREREILGLVAEGSTNAEIAECLWVSPWTARKHLDHISAKRTPHPRRAALSRFLHFSTGVRDQGNPPPTPGRVPSSPGKPN